MYNFVLLLTFEHFSLKCPQVTKLSRMAVSADLPDNSIVRVSVDGGDLQYVVHTLSGVGTTNGNGKRPQYASPDEGDVDDMQL